MKYLILLMFYLGFAPQIGYISASEADPLPQGWVLIKPLEFTDAINNPLKGFREYKKAGYGLLERKYIRWNEIELAAGDTVDRIIAHTNKITITQGKRFEDLNVKLIPRVFLDWDGGIGTAEKPSQHWPTDLHTFDYDSSAFQSRLEQLIAKLGEAWDNDPRIYAVQMGLIGHFGEHHHPAPTPQQRRLLTEAFQKAFKNKPILVRHNDPEFMQAGFGIYYDTFANISREPPHGPKDQFPWQAMNVYQNIWKNAPIEGEVEYNWQQQRPDAKPEETFGRTPNDTMKNLAYRRYMIDKIRKYHVSYLGWIDDYNPADPDVLSGAAEIQKVFGYRFVLRSVAYPTMIQSGGMLPIHFSVQNNGSAPFYQDWPLAIAFLDPKTKNVIFSAGIPNCDIRNWLPGSDWDSATFQYKTAAKIYSEKGHIQLPPDLKSGQYLLAMGILDRQGGMQPSVRFAIQNYLRGGWHPIGYIGVNQPATQVELKDIRFDSPAFDDSLHYDVPARFRNVKMPPVPSIQAVTPWVADPTKEWINPHRYWTLQTKTEKLEKQIQMEKPNDQRIMRLTGEFSKGPTLNYTFGKGVKLPQGKYRFTSRLRGTPGLKVEFELADSWRKVKTIQTWVLKESWQEHTIDFEIQSTFKEDTTLRFNIPGEVQGFVDIAETLLKSIP